MAQRLADLVVVVALCAVMALLVTALKRRPVSSGDAASRATVAAEGHALEPFP